MKTSRFWFWGAQAIVLSFLVLIAGPAQAGLLDNAGGTIKKAGKDISSMVASAKLPGGVSSRLKKMHKEMAKAEKALEKGAGTAVDRAKRAERNLKLARGYKKEIETRYSGKYSEDHPDVAEAFGRFARLEENVRSAGESAAGDEDARRSVQEAEEAGAAKAQAEPEAAKKDISSTVASAKLPSGVSSRLKKMHKEMAKAEKALEKGAGTRVDRAKRAERNLKLARGYKKEIETRYSGKYSEDHPDVAEAFGRFARLEENVRSAGESAAADEDTRRSAQEAEEAAAAKAQAEREAAKKAQAEATAASRQQVEQECKNWHDRIYVYTNGDKALYRCVSAQDDAMPACKASYDEAAALLDEFKQTPHAADPCESLRSVLSDLTRYMENFMASYELYEKKQAAAKANLGEIVFSKSPIDPNNPSKLTRQFQTGDYIYGLIRTTKPWSAIYKNQQSANVMVNVKLDDKKIHAQFVNLKKPELMKRTHIVFEIAPDPGKMTAYSNPDIEYGKSTATMRQGPNELTHHLGQLGPGKHTMQFEIQYYGTIWAVGEFTVEGKDFEKYAKLHTKIAEEVAQSVTLPSARKVDKKMVTEMKALLENAGWSKIHRINIIDKDWWIDRTSGGNSPVKSRHIAAAALAKGSDGGYYYKICTFHQDRLITGGFGKLYLSHQGNTVPIPKKNIDK